MHGLIVAADYCSRRMYILNYKMGDIEIRDHGSIGSLDVRTCFDLAGFLDGHAWEDGP